MSEHTHPTVRRHCDVAVVGGSAAGLAAALQLVRQRRSVIVVDAGDPRNAPAAHMHGYLGFDGQAPAALVAAGRADVRRYGGEVIPGRVVDVTRSDAAFQLELAGGHTIVALRVLAATGLTDELPDIPGLAEHWGRDVIHCPFCHGFEFRDRRLVQIVTDPMGLHPAPLFRRLTDRHTVVLHGDVDVDDARIEALTNAGVHMVRGSVTRLVEDAAGDISGVALANRTIDADVVAVGPGFAARVGPFASLGLVPSPHPSGLGTVLVTDERGSTSVAGVYAAGNVTDPSHNVPMAAAHGSWTGAMIAFDLAEQDMTAGAFASGNAADWDHRYSGERMWSGRPNGALVREVDGLAPGRALDIGAGEGGDAIWLAERGWRVTASDISRRALERIASESDSRSLDVECLDADANAPAPFPAQAFDLVTAHYASIPRTPDDRAVENILGAVAPGGTLLVVTHDPEPMRTPVDTAEHSRPFDPEAYVAIDDVVTAITRLPDWHIEVHATVPRPSGAASSHHVDDVVLRARRTGR